MTSRHTLTLRICYHSLLPAGAVLPEALESVLAETHRDTQIVVVDDGSQTILRR